MFKKLFILGMMVTSLFGNIRELTDENFDRATGRGLVVVEFWATWNEANKVTILDEWDTFDAKVYRLNIDMYPKVQSDNKTLQDSDINELSEKIVSNVIEKFDAKQR